MVPRIHMVSAYWLVWYLNPMCYLRQAILFGVIFSDNIGHEFRVAMNRLGHPLVSRKPYATFLTHHGTSATWASTPAAMLSLTTWNYSFFFPINYAVGKKSLKKCNHGNKAISTWHRFIQLKLKDSYFLGLCQSLIYPFASVVVLKSK